MSNYLQSKWKIVYPLLYLSLAACTSSGTPQHKEAVDQQHSVNTQPQSGQSYCIEQIEKLYKSFITNPSVFKEEQTISSQTNDIRQRAVNELTNRTKGFIYDPRHPEKIFDSMIAGYTFMTATEKQFIPYGEKVLGDKNQLIITAKEKYTEQIQLLNGLKEQRMLLEQSKFNK